MIEIRGAVKRFGETTALDGLSLDVAPGECVALVGESGSGKTTLLRSINALVALDEGRVWVSGRSLSEWDPVALRRRIGYVPQEGGLLPHWRVLRNVALVPSLRGRPEPLSDARTALDRVGLPADETGDRWPRSLSGGQRQRVAIARALAGRPSIILLDEPFGALDAITRSDLQVEFGRLRRELGLTAVLVTHDVREALLLGDRIGVVRSGRLERIGTEEELRAASTGSYTATLLGRAGVGAG